MRLFELVSVWLFLINEQITGGLLGNYQVISFTSVMQLTVGFLKRLSWGRQYVLLTVKLESV